MAKQKKLGLCWGDDGISLVEVNRDVPVAASHVSFEPLLMDPLVGITSLTEDLRLLDLIQDAIKVGKFSTSDAHLSLPSKDIILRWFMIPWMKPNEIHSVVSFEAKKYIPFPIEELIFTYYPSTFTKDGVRQIGVVFVGIRKGVFASYANVVRQAGLNLVYSEPASMSLVRALVLRKQINTDQVTAVVNFVNNLGEIIITSHGYVKFIRDFHISSQDKIASERDKAIWRAKLFNEVKMSLDFFSRQQEGSDVTHVVTLSSGLNRDVWDGLGEDLGMPVRGIDLFSILDKVTSPEVGHVDAFGAALSGVVPSVIDFNLSEGYGQQEKKKEKTRRDPSSPMVFVSIGAAILAGTIFLGAWIWTAQQVASRETQKAAWIKNLGVFADVPREELVTNTGVQKRKLAAVKTLTFRTDVAKLFVQLSKLLPSGVWLNNLSFSSKEAAGGSRGAGAEDGYSTFENAASLTMTGYAFMGNTNAEFQAVNVFLDTIKTDPMFSDRFKSVTLGALETTDVQGIEVTSFSINCE